MPDWYEGAVWQRSPRHIVSAAVVALDDDGRLLLVRSPLRGWEMPGGQVEIGESLEAAARREVHEESGIEVDDLVFCGVFQSLEKSIVNVLFKGRCVGGAPLTSAESTAPLTPIKSVAARPLLVTLPGPAALPPGPTITPTSMYPECAIDEYARMRLMLVCSSASTLPTVIVSAAITHSATRTGSGRLPPAAPRPRRR